MAVDERYMRLPSSLRGPFALISTRSGTRLVEYSFAHFLTRLEKTSPSVQCVAKCRRSQMSPRETCQPHIAVSWKVIEKLLETERILKQIRTTPYRLKFRMPSLTVWEYSKVS